MWRKSSYSNGHGLCVEVEGPWRKSSHSSDGTCCVEVGGPWNKSTHSGNGTCCVEVADGTPVGVRDSKDPDGTVLVFDPAVWGEFIGQVKAGRYDLG